MNIIYNDQIKALPLDRLYALFYAVGWADAPECAENMKDGFLRPWLNSALVVSAWDGVRLVGAVRVLSDTMFRSVIYDLLVLPEYQRKGIGGELVRRCLKAFPNSSWIVQTEGETPRFYKKLGFIDMKEGDVVLRIPNKWTT